VEPNIKAITILCEIRCV